jgi:hypothetical protein
MANSLNQNPMYVDTAAVIKAAGTGPFIVDRIVWSGAAANDTVIIQDGGLTLINMSCGTANETIVVEGPFVFADSINVSTLAGGILNVKIR